MRLIDADVVTTDSVSFGRIGDFEKSNAPRPQQGTCGRGPHRKESFHIEGCAVVDRASLDILEAVGEPFEGVPQQPKLGADGAIINSAVIGSPNCSHKIAFSFLNGNLVVPARPSDYLQL